MRETLAESFRRRAARYHAYADNTLATCRDRHTCGTCWPVAEGYRRIAVDYTVSAIKQDIVEGVVRI